MFFDLNVYTACSLTHAPDPFKEEVISFRDELGKHCHMLCFQGLTNDPPYSTYLRDIHGCVYQSHLVVAVVDYPSIGMGYEMATQVEARHKPLLAVAHHDAKVSKLILDPQQEGYQFRRYKDLRKDVIPIVVEILQQLQRQREWQLNLFSETKKTVEAA